MKLKTIAYSVLAAGILAGGAAIGHYATLDREYRVNRDGDQVSITDLVTSNTYPVIRADGQSYMGSAEHNLNGVRVVGQYEGALSMQPVIGDLQDRNAKLEDMIAQRKALDFIEMTGAAVKNSYMNMKHNTLREVEQ